MLEQYEAVLKSLEEMAALKINVSARASGLLKQFFSGSTLLALKWHKMYLAYYRHSIAPCSHHIKLLLACALLLMKRLKI